MAVAIKEDEEYYNNQLGNKAMKYSYVAISGLHRITNADNSEFEEKQKTPKDSNL